MPSLINENNALQVDTAYTVQCHRKLCSSEAGNDLEPTWMLFRLLLLVFLLSSSETGCHHCHNGRYSPCHCEMNKQTTRRHVVSSSCFHQLGRREIRVKRRGLFGLDIFLVRRWPVGCWLSTGSQLSGSYFQLKALAIFSRHREKSLLSIATQCTRKRKRKRKRKKKKKEKMKTCEKEMTVTIRESLPVCVASWRRQQHLTFPGLSAAN